MSRISCSVPRLDFNPRSPYGERLHPTKRLSSAPQFQSTLPLRGATKACPIGHTGRKISIHAPLTGSDVFSGGCCPATKTISIHAPLTGSDLRDLTDDMYLCVFQSTLPLRGATLGGLTDLFFETISIHAPLTGSDSSCGPALTTTHSISIHAPLTGSDAAGLHRHAVVAISIHAPLTGSDHDGRQLRPDPQGFQSTLPLRGATRSSIAGTPPGRISIHAPLTGSDLRRACQDLLDGISIHAPLTGSDPATA